MRMWVGRGQAGFASAYGPIRRSNGLRLRAFMAQTGPETDLGRALQRAIRVAKWPAVRAKLLF
jgi:hypothetical protein